MTEPEPGLSRKRVSRRMVAAGAWSTPLILATAPAPAFAVSPCLVTFPAMPGSGTAGNGWSRTSAINTTNGNSFFTSATNGTGYTLVADPNSNITNVTVTISTTMQMTTGNTYKFTWLFNKYGGNPRQLTCDFRINGASQATGFMDSDSAEPDYTDIRRTVNFTPTPTTPPSTATYTIAYVFTFPAVGILGSNVGDDMQVYSPTVTCS